MKYLLVFLALFIGCASLPAPRKFHYVDSPAVIDSSCRVYRIWVDREFSSRDKESILLAIAEWNHALNGQIRLEVASWDFGMEHEVLQAVMRGEGWIVLKIESRNPMIHDSIENGKKFYTLAWVDKIAGNRMFVVRDRLLDRDIYPVMLHEVGHLLGSEHDKEYLMQPHYTFTEYQCIDKEAATRVAKYQGIAVRHMNYCIYE